MGLRKPERTRCSDGQERCLTWTAGPEATSTWSAAIRMSISTRREQIGGQRRGHVGPEAHACGWTKLLLAARVLLDGAIVQRQIVGVE